MELPPTELMGMTGPQFGRGRRSGYVAKLKKMVYGQRDAGRAWMQLLNEFFIGIRARPCTTDRQLYLYVEF